MLSLSCMTPIIIHPFLMFYLHSTAPSRKQCGCLSSAHHAHVCITFCRVRHGDSVTNPDYYHYQYLVLVFNTVFVSSHRPYMYPENPEGIQACPWMTGQIWNTMIARIHFVNLYLLNCIYKLHIGWDATECLFNQSPLKHIQMYSCVLC